jgi:hypothetical protein
LALSRGLEDRLNYLSTFLSQDQLAEGEQALPNEQKVIRAEAIAMLAQMFTTDDWQAIAHVASQTMAKEILQMGREAAVLTLTI